MRQVPLLFLLFSVLMHSLALANTQLLTFDFPEVTIGCAENMAGPTGVTVFYFPQGAQATVDIRGGSVGTFFTPQKMQQGEAYLDGIVFAGGGILGLEAVSGVVSHLFAKPNPRQFHQMPLFSGAVIYDYTPRKNKIHPNTTLGQAALANAKPGLFMSGKHGAGISATVGKMIGNDYYSSGQGGAFQQIGETKIAVFTVVNAVGVILNDKGEIILGSSHKSLDKLNEDVSRYLQQNKRIAFGEDQNTTLTLVITNQKLAPRHLQQLARQVHHALSQVIYPYASILDGDILYMVSTNTITSDLYAPGERIENDLNSKLIYLGMVAGELAKKAVWSAVQKES